MGSFAVDFLLDAAYSGILDCSVATIDCGELVPFGLMESRKCLVRGLDKARLTVEQGVVGHPYSTTDEYQPSDSSKDTLRWSAAARAAESSASSCEFILDARPGFLWIRCRHVGGEGEGLAWGA